MRYAYREQADDLSTPLIEHSPLRQVASMPDIPYLIIHGDKDLAVNKQKHSDRFVAEMRIMAAVWNTWKSPASVTAPIRLITLRESKSTSSKVFSPPQTPRRKFNECVSPAFSPFSSVLKFSSSNSMDTTP